MKKQMGFLMVLVIFIGIPLLTKAAGNGTTDIKSYGNIFYEGSTGSVRLYGEDIALLQSKLASVPKGAFDPTVYSPPSPLVYSSIISELKSHEHRASTANACMIVYDGEKYSGYEKKCECGHKWKEEMNHNLVYRPVDDAYHTISCALSETIYCNGLASRNAAHSMTLYSTDGSHHQNVCADCEFKWNIEECVFDVVSDGENETGGRKYCECGNWITEFQTDITESEQSSPEETEESESEKSTTEESEESGSGQPDPKQTENEDSEPASEEREEEDSEEVEEKESIEQIEMIGEGGIAE